jgi:hypothetical protein
MIAADAMNMYDKALSVVSFTAYRFGFLVFVLILAAGKHPVLVMMVVVRPNESALMLSLRQRRIRCGHGPERTVPKSLFVPVIFVITLWTCVEREWDATFGITPGMTPKSQASNGSVRKQKQPQKRWNGIKLQYGKQHHHKTAVSNVRIKALVAALVTMDNKKGSPTLAQSCCWTAASLQLCFGFLKSHIMIIFTCTFTSVWHDGGEVESSSFLL